MSSTQFLTLSETSTLKAPSSHAALKSFEALTSSSGEAYPRRKNGDDTTDKRGFAKTSSIFSSPNESKWWRTNFALTGAGTSASQILRRRSTKAVRFFLPLPNSNSVYCIRFAPNPPYTLAVATGPRVLLYNPSVESRSSFYRALNRKSSQSRSNDNFDDSNHDEEDEGWDAEEALFQRDSTILQEEAVDHLKSSASPDKTISFPGPVYTMDFRPDGRLIAIGGHEGHIRIVDTQTKSVVRSLVLHDKASIRTLKWLRDGKYLLSAGDDALVHVWDTSQPSRSTPVLILRGHGDSIRDMVLLYIRQNDQHSKKDDKNVSESRKRKASTGTAASPSLRCILVTGSYDLSVRVWDLQAALMQVESKQNSNKRANHGGSGMMHDDASTLDLSGNKFLLSKLYNGVAVESLVRLKGYDVVVAGGTSLKLWNVLQGKLVRENSTGHSKSITDVIVAQNVGHNANNDGQASSLNLTTSRILTTGLDGFLRIFDPVTLQCLHGSRNQTPLMALAVSPLTTGPGSPSRLLVHGSLHGQLFVQHRPHPKQDLARLTNEATRLKNESTVSSGMGIPALSDETTVQVQRQRKVSSYQKALRQFRYGDALDGALLTKQPQIVCAFLEELSRKRGGLEAALSNRDEESLEPILAFCSRYVTMPQYAPLLVDVTHAIIQIYEEVLGQSAVIDQLVEKITRVVHAEVLHQEELMTLSGALEGIITLGQISNNIMSHKHN